MKPSEFRSPPIPADEAPKLRAFINECIADGVPEGMELLQLDPNDLDAPKDAPPTRPGVRHFYLHWGPAPGAKSGDDWRFVFGVDEGVSNDSIAVKRAALLAHVAAIEYPLGDVELCGFELRDRSMNRAEQRENGKDLIEAVRVANAGCDALRDAAADPQAWAPIAKNAMLEGFYIHTRLFPDGRKVLIVEPPAC
jgi:hypothetical protein